ncbi:CHAD domain-containing protein [Planctomycetota bacterium]
MKGPDTSFQLLACRHVRTQTKTLRVRIDSIRIGDDIESIHQARIASRRICTALSIFKAAFPAKKIRRWGKHIRRLIQGLGTARDKDVQIEFVARMVADRAPKKRADLPGLKRLLFRLRQEREAIQPRVIKTLDQLDATGILSEMLTQTTKSTSRLRKAGRDLRSPFVLERRARDIRRTCNKLLRLQSCLEDAEAIQQHHRMRIAAKKLRYTMKIYKKVFDKQLDETIRVIRHVQTLLGDIHDCDVWCELIQTFTQEERQRTIEYYGHARSFHRLRLGFEYLRNERITHRRETFNELVALWKELQGSKFWEELIISLEAPHAESCSQAPDDVIIQTGRPTSEIEHAPVSHDSEESNIIRTRSSQVESPEILDEREEHSLSQVHIPGKEKSQSCTPKKRESEAETVEATPSAAAETIHFFETSHHGESSRPDHTTVNSTAPDHSAVSSTPSTENAICECCGQSICQQDELTRIDSGQLLCPGCLGELHEKAGY